MPRDFFTGLEHRNDIQNYLDTIRKLLEDQRQEREDRELAIRIQNEINQPQQLLNFNFQMSPYNLINNIHNSDYNNDDDDDNDDDNDSDDYQIRRDMRAWEPFFRLLGNRRIRNSNPDGMSYDELTQLQERIGFVSKGLDQKELKKIHSVKYSTIEEIEKTNCTICMSEYSPDDDVVQFTSCKHIYHKECITTWLALNKTCPVCRSDF